MKIIADLHIHSKYSRATSNDLSIENLSKWARVKGVNLLSTGDFTHPSWLSELKSKLNETEAGSGIFQSADGFNFILQTEISSIYEQDGRFRKIHNIILAPSFEIVEQINELLAKKADLAEDGRPTFSGYSCPELVGDMKRISQDIHVIPAHAWTPWFSVFGSNSGFDNIKDCFQEQLNHIFAIETGLSSNPAMNWRLSQLDKMAFVSFSDLHSYWPWRIGREASVFELSALNYRELFDAIKNKDPNKFLYTIEVDPAYGKYHFDGHRLCDVCLEPSESLKYKNICPNCGRRLTIGVAHRVEALADRPASFIPANAIPFKSVIPLHELLAKALGISLLSSERVWREYNRLIALAGSELSVLLETPFEELKKATAEKIASFIIAARENKIKIKAGYDGVYGEPIFDETSETKQKIAQKNLGQFTK